MAEPKTIVDHETEMHGHDEQILATLWGSKRSNAEGGGRNLEQGLVMRVSRLEGGRAITKIARSDKVQIAVIVAVFQFVAWLLSR